MLLFDFFLKTLTICTVPSWCVLGYDRTVAVASFVLCQLEIIPLLEPRHSHAAEPGFLLQPALSVLSRPRAIVLPLSLLPAIVWFHKTDFFRVLTRNQTPVSEPSSQQPDPIWANRPKLHRAVEGEQYKYKQQWLDVGTFCRWNTVQLQGKNKQSLCTSGTRSEAFYVQISRGKVLLNLLKLNSNRIWEEVRTGSSLINQLHLEKKMVGNGIHLLVLVVLLIFSFVFHSLTHTRTQRCAVPTLSCEFEISVQLCSPAPNHHQCLTAFTNTKRFKLTDIQQLQRPTGKI